LLLFGNEPIMRQKVFFILLVLICSLNVVPSNAVLSPSAIPAVFDRLLAVPALSNPAMILIDGTTGETVYQRKAYSQRKPASVMKLLAGVATLKYLDPESTFLTSISIGEDSRTLVIQGSYDPWISTSHIAARKMNRASLPYLANSSMAILRKANANSLEDITVIYSKLFSQDVLNFKSFWAERGFKPEMKAVSSTETLARAGEIAADEESPKLYEILEFTLLWSDNLLAERLSRLASRAAGYAFNIEGVAQTFGQILRDLEIDPAKLKVLDASGLSKGNRVTASLIGQLLFKIHKDEKYDLIYSGLPVGGVSGTLETRFLSTAPQAVGLVRAKTGTLNGTVTLAGFVESADREYIFVTLADDIQRGVRASDKARAAIDRILGRIAAPNIPTEISEVEPAP
jgi:D-alanyl-D-alanine carboxypeptidase/D-alanyl-D-alanine-endopeptidase (penicillin-binding protein 4)